MNPDLTPAEQCKSALHAVQRWVNKGMCVKCSINAVCADFDIDYGKLEDLWVRSEMAKIEDDVCGS